MKSFMQARIFIILVFILCSLGEVYYAEIQEGVNIDQMVEGIREFMDDPSLKVDQVGEIFSYRGRTYQSFYVGKNYFAVATDKGEVCKASLWENRTYVFEPEETGSPLAFEPTFSKAEANSVAYNFALAKCPGFKDMNMILFENGFGMMGYHFHWVEELPQPKTSFISDVNMFVDPWNGKIIDYEAWHWPLTISTIPKIDREKAISIAKEIVGRGEPKEVILRVWWDVLDEQYLFWHVDLMGIFVCLDAQTGQVLSVNTLGGLAAGLPKIEAKYLKPRLGVDGEILNIYNLVIQDGITFVPAKALQLLGAGAKTINDKMIISKGSKEIAIRRQKNQILVNETRFTIPKTNYYAIVPLRPLCEALGIPISWQPKDKIINVITKKTKP